MNIGRLERITMIAHPRELLLILREQPVPNSPEDIYDLLILHEAVAHKKSHERVLFQGGINTRTYLLAQLYNTLSEGLKLFKKQLENPRSLESLALQAKPKIAVERILTDALIERIITDLYSEKVAVTYDYV
jgi:hypothetical protein